MTNREKNEDKLIAKSTGLALHLAREKLHDRGLLSLNIYEKDQGHAI